jgi:hypothetical protein
MINKRRRYGERAAVMLVILTVSITIVIVSIIYAFFFDYGCSEKKSKAVFANGGYNTDIILKGWQIRPVDNILNRSCEQPHYVECKTHHTQ